jgi:hypothetical protein
MGRYPTHFRVAAFQKETAKMNAGGKKAGLTNRSSGQITAARLFAA